MSNSNLKINLHQRKDKDGKVFYIGKLKVNANLNLRNGLVFLCFIAEPGEEELQICDMDKAEKHNDQY